VAGITEAIIRLDRKDLERLKGGGRGETNTEKIGKKRGVEICSVRSKDSKSIHHTRARSLLVKKSKRRQKQ